MARRRQAPGWVIGELRGPGVALAQGWLVVRVWRGLGVTGLHRPRETQHPPRNLDPRSKAGATPTTQPPPRKPTRVPSTSTPNHHTKTNPAQTPGVGRCVIAYSSFPAHPGAGNAGFTNRPDNSAKPTRPPAPCPMTRTGTSHRPATAPPTHNPHPPPRPNQPQKGNSARLDAEARLAVVGCKPRVLEERAAASLERANLCGYTVGAEVGGGRELDGPILRSQMRHQCASG